MQHCDSHLQATVLKTRRFPIYCHAKMLIVDDEVRCCKLA